MEGITSSETLINEGYKTILTKLVTKYMKENNYTSFQKFKTDFFNCLVRLNVITITNTPPSTTSTSSTEQQSDDDEPSVFDEYGVEEEDIDTDQYLEPQQFRQGIKQWEQMSIQGGTRIEGESEQIKKMRKKILYTNVKTSIEKALQDGIVKIKEAGDSFGLSGQIINAVINIWEQIVAKFNKEDNRQAQKQIKKEWVVFSFLYITNEIKNLNLPLPTVFEEFNVKSNKMKYYNRWVSQNKNILPKKEIQDIMFCNFELTPQNKKELYDYVKQIEDENILTNNISPRNNIKAKTTLVYWYLKDKLRSRVTKKSVQEACNSATSTEFYQAIKRKLS